VDSVSPQPKKLTNETNVIVDAGTEKNPISTLRYQTTAVRNHLDFIVFDKDIQNNVHKRTVQKFLENAPEANF
jgi:hypothetical protein